jgi:hypothetical protein
LELRRCESRWGAGTLSIEGKVGLAGPLVKKKAPTAVEIAVTDAELSAVLHILGVELEGGSEFKGRLEGSAAVAEQEGGVSADLDLLGKGLGFIDDGTPTVALPDDTKISGKVLFEDSGAIGVSGAHIEGSGVDLQLESGHYTPPGDQTGSLRLKGRAVCDHTWLLPRLQPWMPAGIAIEGKTEVEADIDAVATASLESWTVSGRLSQDALVTDYGRLEDLILGARLEEGTLHVEEGHAGMDGGRIAVKGVVDLLGRKGDAADRCELDMTRLPISFETTGSGGAELTTRFALSGSTTITAQEQGGWLVATRLDTSDASRVLRNGQMAVDPKPLPDLELHGSLSVSEDLSVIEGENLVIDGDGVAVAIASIVYREEDHGRSIETDTSLHLSAQAFQFILHGIDIEDLTAASSVQATACGKVSLASDGSLSGIHGDAHVQVPKISIDGQECHAEIEGSVRDGLLTISQLNLAGPRGGSLALEHPATAQITGDRHPFSIAFSAKQIHLGKAHSRRLGVFNPLLVVDQEQEGAGLSCVLSLDLEVSGTYEETPDWSTSVNGKGRIEVRDGEIVGSQVIMGMAAKAPLAFTNVINESIQAVSGGGGSPAEVLTGMSKNGYHFKKVETPITITAGRIETQPDLRIKSPEMNIILNGYSTVSGDVDYRLKTDVIGRLRGKAITDLPGKIPLIGGIFKAVNPLQVLDQIELGATVRGNVFEKKEDGSPAIEVEVGMGK